MLRQDHTDGVECCCRCIIKRLSSLCLCASRLGFETQLNIFLWAGSWRIWLQLYFVPAAASIAWFKDSNLMRAQIVSQYCLAWPYVDASN